MKRFNRRVFSGMVAALATSLALAACNSGAAGPQASGAATQDRATSEGKLKPVNFTLNFFPLADHAPDYVALDKGWFEEDGLGVNIIQGSGSGTAIRRVTTGQADIGIADVGVTINAIRGGADIKIIMITIDRGTASIYASKKSRISSVKDLVGKRIGAPPEDAGRLMFPALASATGFSPEQVKWVDIQPASQWQILARGQVDAILSSSTQAPFAWKALGKDNTVQLDYADNGVDVYSQAIFARTDYIEKNKDLLKDFLDSVLRGWVFTYENPDEALEIEKKYSPAIDLKDYRQNLQYVLDYNNSANSKQNGLGFISAEKMKQTMDIVQKYMPGTGKNIEDVDQIYTNELLTRYDIPS